MLLIFSAGMAALLNASHEGAPVHFEGPITRMESPRGKSNDYLITVQDEATQREVTFATDVHTYRPLNISRQEGKNPRFQRDMNIGLLGMPFRWK